MTLTAYTARIAYRGADRLDITRKSGTDGLIFTPSWAILRPALAAMQRAISEDDPEIAREAWEAYQPCYIAEMRVSYRAHRGAWEALLGQDTATLCCYCVARGGVLRCHRRLLAGILVRLGAVDGGER